jgi:hypothetical protein
MPHVVTNVVVACWLISTSDHNCQETLFACSQVGYFDETWGQEESKKRSTKTQYQEGEWYNSKFCKHKENQALFFARTPTTILQQVSKNTHLELERKTLQFATLFQILEVGRPMVEYEKRKSLYSFLGGLKTLKCTSLTLLARLWLNSCMPTWLTKLWGLFLLPTMWL